MMGSVLDFDNNSPMMMAMEELEYDSIEDIVTMDKEEVMGLSYTVTKENKENTVEVIADTAQVIVEEVDTIETKVEEEKKEEDEDLEVNAANDRLSRRRTWLNTRASLCSKLCRCRLTHRSSR